MTAVGAMGGAGDQNIVGYAGTTITGNTTSPYASGSIHVGSGTAWTTPNIIHGEFLPPGALGDLAKKLETDLDLAAAVREFYKEILDQPLSAEMLEKWERLSRLVAAVCEMAGKYTPLIEEEITSKIEG